MAGQHEQVLRCVLAGAGDAGGDRGGEGVTCMIYSDSGLRVRVGSRVGVSHHAGLLHAVLHLHGVQPQLDCVMAGVHVSSTIYLSSAGPNPAGS